MARTRMPRRPEKKRQKRSQSTSRFHSRNTRGQQRRPSNTEDVWSASECRRLLGGTPRRSALEDVGRSDNEAVPGGAARDRLGRGEVVVVPIDDIAQGFGSVPNRTVGRSSSRALTLRLGDTTFGVRQCARPPGKAELPQGRAARAFQNLVDWPELRLPTTDPRGGVTGAS